MKEIPIQKRFWEKVNKTDHCWEWTGGTSRGYGQIHNNKKKGMMYCHRLSWEIHYGFIPQHLCVLHHCDNPLCVRPTHLFLGTQKDNAIDMVKKGRCPDRKGEKNNSAKLKENNVREIRELFTNGNLSQREIGEKFNVCTEIIYRIIHKRSWGHVL